MDWQQTDFRQEKGWKLSGDTWKVLNYKIVTMAVTSGGMLDARYSRNNYRNKSLENSINIW